VPATRVEIAEHVAGAFAAGPVSRDDLLATARATGARRAVVQVLEQLRGGPFHEMRQLWPALPEVPIEPEIRSGSAPG
jgi:hypothetical protein